jgi:outer membrane protein TolC
VKLAEETLQRVQAQYRAGEARILDVTEAELQRTRSRLALLRSRVQLILWQARLRRITGSGIHREG